MSQRLARPELHLCGKCATRRSLTPAEAGALLSRHFDRLPIRSVTYQQMSDKRGDPTGWMDHVEKSIVASQVVSDPVALAETENGLEIIEGNHRAWIAYHYRMTLPAMVFAPVCGRCTEALFCDVANAWTREIGWLHRQQGF